MLNLAVVLEDAARSEPERVALVAGDARMTYREVDASASRIASWLVQNGVGRGHRVALTCPNVPTFPMVYFGALKVGAVVVPLNVLLKAGEIAYHLEDSGATVYFCFEDTPDLPMGTAGWQAYGEASRCENFVVITADPTSQSPFGGAPTLTAVMAGQPSAFPSVSTAEADPAVILYTSGTTGQPKGAELSHSNMVHNALLGPKVFGAIEPDTHLLALPLFHSFGQTVNMNMGFATQSTLVFMPRFEPRTALALMAKERVTFFAGVPTMYWALLGYRPDEGEEAVDLGAIASSLRICASGGSPMPLEVLRGFEERYSVKVLEGYGLSETSPVATFNRVGKPTKPGTVGLPVWGVQVRVVDTDAHDVGTGEPGEVLIRGHNIMNGYRGRPEATAEVIDADGWFATGDIGTLDEDGYLTIVDRAKDMIIRGGFNVYPREVEEVLITHPAVSLVAVVGVPHEEHGEEVKAFVVKAKGVDVAAEELIDWASEQMASFKYPRTIEFRDALPMTATGKILKRELV